MNKSKKLDKENNNIIKVLKNSYKVDDANANTVSPEELPKGKYLTIYNRNGKPKRYIISKDKEDIETILAREKDENKE